MKKLTLILGIISTLMVALWSSAQTSNFRVVVHPNNPVVSLSSKDVSGLLLKRMTRWRGGDIDGTLVSPIDLDTTNPIREAFSQAIHGRSTSSIKSYWQRQIFKGKDIPPPEVRSDDDVLNHVRRNSGAIGYVSAEASLDGVKEVKIGE